MQGIILTPLWLRFTSLPDLGRVDLLVEQIHLSERLEGWRFMLTGLDLDQLKTVEYWLTKRFECDEAQWDAMLMASMTDMEFVAVAFQVLMPSGEKGIRIGCMLTSEGMEPRAVSEPRRLTGTNWVLRIGSRTDELNILPVVAERVEAAFTGEMMPRIKNAIYCFGQGMHAAEPQIRTLLWCMGLDAILMAGNRREFCSRLKVLLRQDAFVFPASRDGMQPSYRVGEVVDDLYSLRSEIAHGSRLSPRFMDYVGFFGTSGENLRPEYTHLELLEECALFLLQRCLKTVLATDLFNVVQDERQWRQVIRTGLVAV